MRNPAGAHLESTPDATAVMEELARLAASGCFRKAERCLRLLRYLTNLSLGGRTSELKEYSLGVSVFDRPESYDPRTDPVVRLEARRLRLKLAEYYQTEGLNDPVEIQLPKGAYVPEFRFRSPASNAVAPVAAQPPTPPRNNIGIWVIAAMLLLGGAMTWSRWRTPPPRFPVRTSIAVLGFQDLSARPESAWIAEVLSELLYRNLGSDQQLRILPLENVARMRSEMSLAPQSSYSVSLLQRIRGNLGSDYVVTGSYSKQANRIHWNLIVSDARSGQQTAAIVDESPEDQVQELAHRCAARVRAQLGVRLAPGGQPPFEAGAMEPYARGMEHLRRGDFLSARTYLEKAAEASESNPLIHSGLAATWSGLGLDARAEKEAKLALDDSGDLGRVEALEIQGRYYTTAHNWKGAIRVYQALFTLLPDDLEYGLQLASAQTRGGDAKEAFEAVKTLRSLPSPLGDDPRIDLAEAQAAGALSDFARTQRAAHIAADKANARGAKLLYARARLLESGAMETAGVAGFAALRNEARNLCARLGDRACVAAAYRIEANQKAASGDIAGARSLYQLALNIAEQSGNMNEELNALTGFAYAARLGGDLPAAESYLERALIVGSELGPSKLYPVCLDLSEVLADDGHLARAHQLIEEAGRVSRQIGEKEGIAMSRAALAHVNMLEGKSDDAAANYGEAVATLRTLDEPFELRQALLAMGDADLEHGDLASARKAFEEARAATRRISVPFDQSDVELAFARLDFAEAHFANAVSRSRTAVSGFTSQGREGDRLQAAAVLMRALLRQGSPDAAAAAMTQFASLNESKLPPRSVAEFGIARSFVLATAGKREEANRAIDDIMAMAKRTQIPQLAQHAEQARKELERPHIGNE
jgi:TolB-like protein